LLTGTARQARLDYLASISDPALTEEIKEGVVSNRSSHPHEPAVSWQ